MVRACSLECLLLRTLSCCSALHATVLPLLPRPRQDSQQDGAGQAPRAAGSIGLARAARCPVPHGFLGSSMSLEVGMHRRLTVFFGSRCVLSLLLSLSFPLSAARSPPPAFLICEVVCHGQTAAGRGGRGRLIRDAGESQRRRAAYFGKDHFPSLRPAWSVK